MNKLKSIKELDFSPLSNSEAIATKGGWGWEDADGGVLLDEVTIYANPPFDSGAWWEAVGSGAAGGFVTGAMLGYASGSDMGPAGSFLGAVGGALAGTVYGVIAGGVSNYYTQIY